MTKHQRKAFKSEDTRLFSFSTKYCCIMSIFERTGHVLLLKEYKVFPFAIEASFKMPTFVLSGTQETL